MKLYKYVLLILLLHCFSVGLSFAENEQLQDTRLKAELGYPVYQFDLGYYYFEGEYGLEVNKRAALEWIERSAEQGYARAQYYMGFMYNDGEGVVQDKKEAAKWYKKAAVQGYGPAYSELAVLYDEGLGIKRNAEEAARLSELAANFKEIKEWFNQSGHPGIPVAERTKLLLKAAEHGHVLAQSFLGRGFYLGMYGLPVNKKEAAKWHKKAAEQGNLDSQRDLALMYSEGDGVSQDIKEATKWSKKAADQGDLNFQKYLGWMYFYGDDGFVQDRKQAAKWLRKAAEQGSDTSQFLLGRLFSHGGEGVSKDKKEAAKWYRKAAEQGVEDAQFNLGLLYDVGDGIREDKREAAKWYRKAAEQGVENAQLNLGLLYYKGEGVLQDEIMSYALWSVASAGGSKLALKYRDQIAERLSKQEIKQGRKIAADWQRKIEQKKTSGTDISTPKVATNEPKISGSGSAFIVTNNGYIITCYHVIKDASKVIVTSGNKEYQAKLVRVDKNNDVALLKIDGEFPALSFASRNSVRMGSDVFTIGYPNPILQGVNQKLTEGNINALTGFQDDIRLYQISTPIQPGNSGGALLNGHGDVVGVIVSILQAEAAFKISGSLPQNVNYALKSTYAQALIDTVPDAVDSLQEPHRKKSKNVVERVKDSVVMVLAYR